MVKLVKLPRTSRVLGGMGELHEKDAAFKYGWELYFGVDSAHVDAPLPTTPLALTSAQDTPGSARGSQAEARQSSHGRERPGTLLIPCPGRVVSGGVRPYPIHSSHSAPASLPSSSPDPQDHPRGHTGADRPGEEEESGQAHPSGRQPWHRSGDAFARFKAEFMADGCRPSLCSRRGTSSKSVSVQLQLRSSDKERKGERMIVASLEKSTLQDYRRTKPVASTDWLMSTFYSYTSILGGI